MIITESELRELWRDGRKALPAFAPDTRFTPAAQDFLKDHGLTPVFAAPNPPPAPTPTPTALPGAAAAGALLARLDTLQALAGLIAAEARRARLPELAAHLDTLAAYGGELRSAAIQARAPANLVWSRRPPGADEARPGPEDHALAHWLNYLRAITAETAATAPDGMQPGLRRLESAAEDLLSQFLSGALAWKAGR